MAKWMKFFLNNGKLPNGTRLVSASAFKNIIRPSNVIAKTYTSTYFTKPKIPVTTSQTGYSLGWRTGHYRGEFIIRVLWLWKFNHIDCYIVVAKRIKEAK